MTKRTKSKASPFPTYTLPFPNLNTDNITEVGVTGKYGTRSVTSLPFPSHQTHPPQALLSLPKFTQLTPINPPHQIRRLPPETSQEDGNQPTRPLHLHILRENDREEAQCGYLELQELQEDGSGGRLDGFVSAAFFIFYLHFSGL